MATYLKTDVEITRQEGDTADIVFVVEDAPTGISLTGFTEIIFAAFHRGTEIFRKTLSGATLSVLSQTITIPLLVADTKGYAGDCDWELEISNSTPLVYTIAGGTLIIKKERI